MPQPSIRIEGDVVLRFGFVEGDAVGQMPIGQSTIRRALRVFEPFSRNGSRAFRIGACFERKENFAVLGIRFEIEDTARRIISSGEANVLIAKGGIKGRATFFKPNNPTVFIPAYRSTRVFKIGDRRCFLVLPSPFIGEQKRMDATEAAELASRSVAHYCGSGHLPLPAADDLLGLRPVGSLAFRPICIGGAAQLRLGDDGVLEEARWRLQQLGFYTP